MEEWETPEFVRMRKKKAKRDSPYSEAEIWELAELLTIIKYEPYTRNKAALTNVGFQSKESRSYQAENQKHTVNGKIRGGRGSR